MNGSTRLTIGLNAAIFAVTEEVPRVLTVDGLDPTEQGSERAGRPLPALPFGPLDPEGDRTLELGLRGWVHEQTGLGLGYVEQLYTFGDRDRELAGERLISVAYLALVREATPSAESDARWRNVYGFLPWEDWREGQPPILESHCLPGLRRWVAAPGIEGAERSERTERVEIAFGLGRGRWDEKRVLDRYELLWQAGLVGEAERRQSTRDDVKERAVEAGAGEAMALDHRRMLATALGRLRGKLEYRPVVFELMPPTFTLLQLQRVVEALAGIRLHKQNFRRLVERGGLVEGTGEHEKTGGRPAELFRFRKEVLRERPAPGVGLPAARRTGVA